MPASDGSESRPIVVGVDGSDSSKEALSWAAKQAAFTGAPIHALITWEYPTSYGWAEALPADFSFEDDARDSLHNTVTEVLGPEASAQVVESVLEGHAAPRLIEESEKASLIVVGCRGHGGFAGMVLGSVSAHVVAHAHCPVVVVHGHN